MNPEYDRTFPRPASLKYKISWRESKPFQFGKIFNNTRRAIASLGPIRLDLS